MRNLSRNKDLYKHAADENFKRWQETSNQLEASEAEVIRLTADNARLRSALEAINHTVKTAESAPIWELRQALDRIGAAARKAVG